MVPRLPGFDAKAFTQRLFERVRSDSGAPFGVFDPASSNSLVEFVKALRGQRDIVSAHDYQLADQAGRLAANSGKLSSLEDRVAALEAQPERPFPASG